MKKLVLFAAVIVALSFASCKQKAAPEPVVDEPAIEAVDEAAAAVDEAAAVVDEAAAAVDEAAAVVEEAVTE